MASKIKPRDVTPIISWWRNLLCQTVDIEDDSVNWQQHFTLDSWLKSSGNRTIKNYLRFEGGISAREQAPPNIAEGPSHKLSSVAYQDRDGRRTAHPPKYLAPETINGLQKNLKTPLPGQLFAWDKQ